MTVPAKQPTTGEIAESVYIKGDLASLNPEQRTTYYMEVCRSLGLNPLTQPLEYIVLNGKLKLYAKRDAADQLRKLNGISIQIVSQDALDSLLSVHVRASDKTGRQDEDVGVVTFVYPARFKDPRDGQWRAHPKAGKQLENEDRANAVMKCVTKAKRRVTLSIAGLGFLDETEVDDIADARRPKPPAPAPNAMLPPHDRETGEITEPETAADTAPPSENSPVSDTSEGGADEVAMVRQPKSALSLEDEAREAAKRGSEIFRVFYRRLNGPQQERVKAIQTELRSTLDAADARQASHAADATQEKPVKPQ